MTDREPHAPVGPELCSLRDLEIGEEAVVHGFREFSAYAERLLRLGLIQGTRLRLERRAPLGDPVQIRFRGYSLVLRPTEADCLRLARP